MGGFGSFFILNTRKTPNEFFSERKIGKVNNNKKIEKSRKNEKAFFMEYFCINSCHYGCILL